MILNFCLIGQNSISGVVTDEISKEKLAFVNIVVNENGTLGTTSDIDGNFIIKSREEIKNLTFSFVGYEKKKIEIEYSDDKDLEQIITKLCGESVFDD